MILRQHPIPDRQIGLIVAALSFVSLGAFIAQVYGIFDMAAVLSFAGIPAVLAIVGIVRLAVRANRNVFVYRVKLGLALGAIATAAYDIARLIIQTALPLNFNAFANHPKFGALITHEPATETVSIVTGWAYHISNGLTFALAFALVAGRARWGWGLLYAMVLQTAMVTVYPRAFGVERGSEAFLVVSFVGHAVYGTVLGVMNRRYNKDDTWGTKPYSGSAS